MSAAQQCQCGEVTGVACEGTARVVVEWMPEYLRESHRAAGHTGVWPHNGALHLAVALECAHDLVRDDQARSTEESWVEIVGPVEEVQS